MKQWSMSCEQAQPCERNFNKPDHKVSIPISSQKFPTVMLIIVVSFLNPEGWDIFQSYGLECLYFVASTAPKGEII